MRTIVTVTLMVLISASASAQVRHLSASNTLHAMVLPVASCISSGFGPRILPDHPQAGTYHNGVDLPAPEGTPVRAVASGSLLRIQHSGPGGLEVLIQHNGYVTVYSHLASISPSLGSGIVTAGEEVGVVGRTGVSFGPHLFFALLKQGQAVDPSAFLGVPACAGASREDLEMLTQRARLTAHHRYLNDDSGLHEIQEGSTATAVADIYPPQVNLLLTRAPALR